MVLVEEKQEQENESRQWKKMKEARRQWRRKAYMHRCIACATTLLHFLHKASLGFNDWTKTVCKSKLIALNNDTQGQQMCEKRQAANSNAPQRLQGNYIPKSGMVQVAKYVFGWLACEFLQQESPFEFTNGGKFGIALVYLYTRKTTVSPRVGRVP